MRFVLKYDGPLHAEQESREDRARRQGEKWYIRRKIHPQLAELWATSPALKRAKYFAKIPKAPGTYGRPDPHHSLPLPDADFMGGSISLIAPISRAGGSFVPLVRDSLALTCHIDILFLRLGPPGHLVKAEGGDVDNRIKVLFDALQMPAENAKGIREDDPNPFYCLLENDKLIESYAIRTAQLLDQTANDPSTVNLTLEVTIKAILPATYNLPFLGG